MTPQLPEESGSAPARCPAHVTDVRWERIQLILRVERVPESQINVAGWEFFLDAGEGRTPLAGLEVAGHRSGPEARFVRFNLFAGPHRRPIEAGRWRLVHRCPGADVCTVGAAQTLALSTHTSREYLSGTTMFRLDPKVADGGFEVVFTVSSVRTRGAWAPPRTHLRAWWRRFRRRLRVGVFRTFVDTVRLVPRKERLVVFTSDSATELRGNLKLVYDRMLARGLGSEYRLRTILKPSIRSKRSFRDRLRLVWLLGRAGVILLDDYQPAIYQLRSRPDQRIIQLWHAPGAFKTVGYSRIGKAGGTNPFSAIHKNYTYATVSSAYEVPFYAEAFGIPEESVIPTGTPRMEEFLDGDRQAAGRTRALEAFPAALGRRVIVFAPTFRGTNARKAWYQMEQVDLASLHALCRERDAIVIFKMHPFVRRRLEIPPELDDRLFDASRLPIDVNDLLVIADLLVTDYSSVVFEYAALGRPMLFFAYDLEAYVATRDFYEPYEEFVPGRIVRTFSELLDAIRHDDYQFEKVAPFATRHLPEHRGSATDRIIDELVLS